MKNFSANDLLYPGDDFLVKKYRTPKEIEMVKSILKAVILAVFLVGMAFMLFANDLIYLFPLVFLALHIAMTRRNRKADLSKQRKRITKKIQSRDKKREYNRKIKEIQSRKAASKADKEKKEALAREMAIVDERLKEALKPIVWNSPSKQYGVQSRRKPSTVGAEEKRDVKQSLNRKSKRAIKRDFKIVSVDNI